MIDPVYFIQDLAVILLSAAVFGYLCGRAGLSPVVGYLMAGLVVGTPEITVPYVTDTARLEVIAQLGVVFLMFSIGLQFQLRKVRELGGRIVLATAVLAVLVLTMARGSADLLALSGVAGICLAAVFMNSSSAIIGKVIGDEGLGHERYGQVALGITLMEDIVSVVMLAVLGSYLALEVDRAQQSPAGIIVMLAGFAVFVLLVGLLVIPRILRRIGRSGQADLASIFVAGSLLTLALIAVRAGYSLALGAFLFGMIVAETSQRGWIERNFRGLKDVFLTVFFVTIGMTIEVQAIPGALKWILLGTAGALVGRGAAAFVALVAVGERPRQALQSALCLTPIGEFSFIIAGIAVAGGIFSETFQVAVVGTALLTSMVSPLLAKNAPRLTAFLAEGRYPRLDQWHAVYAGLWKGGGASRSSTFWRIFKVRIAQVVLESVFVLMVLVFAEPVLRWIHSALPLPDYFPEALIVVVFWVGVCLLCLVPLVAIWRNLSAMAMILEDFRGRGTVPGRILAAVFHFGYFAILSIAIWNLLPVGTTRVWILAAVVALTVFLVAAGWRNMVQWHSRVEVALKENLSAGGEKGARRLFESHREDEWKLNIEEFTLPDDTALGGLSLRDCNLRARTGCSLVGIERHGYALRSIGPETQLFPGDELLLLGSRAQITAARRFLGGAAQSEEERPPPQRDLVLESIVIPENDAAVGRKLAELDWTGRYGVQVVALRREGLVAVSVDGSTRIEAGDTLLLMGRTDRIQALAEE
ncbi:MAG: cation:proton antiporter [Opitutales bacterium]|nr:cation:proton antiporter [Opitutales bacterium]